MTIKVLFSKFINISIVTLDISSLSLFFFSFFDETKVVAYCYKKKRQWLIKNETIGPHPTILASGTDLVCMSDGIKPDIVCISLIKFEYHVIFGITHHKDIALWVTQKYQDHLKHMFNLLMQNMICIYRHEIENVVVIWFRWYGIE